MDRGKDDVLDSPVVQEGLIGSAIASMQQRFAARKKEDKEIWLCFPYKVSGPAPGLRCKDLPGPQAHQPRVQKGTKLAPAPPALS